MDAENSIFVSAGDPSADFPGKSLIDELLRVNPDLTVFGLGGPLMQAAGLEPLVDHGKLAVMGFWEVLPKLLFFRRLLKKAADEIATKRPRAVVLLDYPGFNLRLAAKIKHLGIPIIYYISPQVWAWGRRRITDIKCLVDLMLVIFPFEADFYREHDVTVNFVGHPIVDRFKDFPSRSQCRVDLGIDDAQTLIGLLPGSREQEVKRMLPVMLEAAVMMAAGHPDYVFRVGGVDSLDRSLYTDIPGSSSIPILFGQTHSLMRAADFIIASSGTATLETAYFATPLLILYKTGFFTYQIARRVVTLDTIGIPNIVAGKKIVPELIQAQATSRKISKTAMEILEDRGEYQRMVRELEHVRDILGGGDVARRAVAAIQEVVPLC